MMTNRFDDFNEKPFRRPGLYCLAAIRPLGTRPHLVRGTAMRAKSSAALCAIVSVALAWMILGDSTAPAQAPDGNAPRVQWEYRTGGMDLMGDHALNAEGEAGWELVTVVPGEAVKFHFIFKRIKR
jgi:hypothetical protein